MAGLLVFWFWKYAHALRLAAEPKMALVKIIERRNNKISSDTIEQIFTLKVKNCGGVPLNHCIVKVDDMIGSNAHEAKPLQVYRSGEGAWAPFMLKVGETEEIFLTRNAVTKGDTFVTAKIMYDGSGVERWIDPDVESEILIGLYSEARPTLIRLCLSRNEKGYLIIKEKSKPPSEDGGLFA
jgi:hypothetical protein